MKLAAEDALSKLSIIYQALANMAEKDVGLGSCHNSLFMRSLEMGQSKLVQS